MKDLQNIVYKFMEREEITLKQALLQSSLGMCSKTGDIAEIVRGVVYNSYPYTDERKKRNKEHLGELLFYWLMLASTCGASPEDIMNEYIAEYVQRTKIHQDDELNALAMRDRLLKEGHTLSQATNMAQSQLKQQNASQASILQMMRYVKEHEPAPMLTTSKLKERSK